MGLTTAAAGLLAAEAMAAVPSPGLAEGADAAAEELGAEGTGALAAAVDEGAANTPEEGALGALPGVWVVVLDAWGIVRSTGLAALAAGT